MNRLLILLGSLLISGCFATTSSPDANRSDALRPERRICSDLRDCMPGELCQRFGSSVVRVCTSPCDALSGAACPTGEACLLVNPATGAGACFPGADPRNPQANCEGTTDCQAGERCRTVGPGAGGDCIAADCATHSDCTPGFACVAQVCTPVCDARDDWQCPDGTVCYFGRCHTLDDARDCESTGEATSTVVPDNCPLGQVCDGTDETWECVAPEEMTLRHGACGEQALLSWVGCFARRTR
jgi:hypothetical protein